jgi:hypothetical protein
MEGLNKLEERKLQMDLLTFMNDSVIFQARFQLSSEMKGEKKVEIECTVCKKYFGAVFKETNIIYHIEIPARTENVNECWFMCLAQSILYRDQMKN